MEFRFRTRTEVHNFEAKSLIAAKRIASRKAPYIKGTLIVRNIRTRTPKWLVASVKCEHTETRSIWVDHLDPSDPVLNQGIVNDASYTEWEVKTSQFDHFRCFRLIRNGTDTGYWYQFPREPEKIGSSAFEVAYGTELPDGTPILIDHIEVPRRLSSPAERAEWFGQKLIEENVNRDIILQSINQLDSTKGEK